MWDKLVLLILGIMGMEDLKKRTISVWKIAVFGMVILLALVYGRGETADINMIPFFTAASGVIPGIVLLILGKLAKGSIGEADGLIVLGLGIYMGFWSVMSVLSVALFLAFIVSGVLLTIGRRRNYEIPFVPFLLLGMAGNMFWR